MKNRINFSNLVEQAMRMPGRLRMRPVIEKELLHYDILFALDQSNLLDQIVFQGGTALRLCYGAERFSEDLDFAGGRAFATNQLVDMKECLERYLGDRYGLEVTVKEPSELMQEHIAEDIRIDKWQISITTSPQKKDIPKQRIKIEVINVPTYSKQPLPLQANYDFLPDGYNDTLVMVETLDEIMADKLIAFVNCTRYIRYRDIWDLYWLKQKSAHIIEQYIISKIKDYRIVDYADKLTNRLVHLNEIINSKVFYDEMSRFIPQSVLERTLLKEKFLVYLDNEMSSLLQQVEKIIAKE